MAINVFTHSISPGKDDESEVAGFQLQEIGHYLNGHTPGSWLNKFTLFFVVYKFLQETEVVTEDLDSRLLLAREAMASWGVGLQVPQEFLSSGDPRTKYGVKELQEIIANYRVSTTVPHFLLHC